MKESGAVYYGNQDMKPTKSYHEIKTIINRTKLGDLFDLAWQAYSRNWECGYALLNLHTGKFENGYEQDIDLGSTYIKLLEVDEADFGVYWGEHEEFAEYEKCESHVSLREWCEQKGINYKERIRWGAGWKLSKLYNDWIRFDAMVIDSNSLRTIKERSEQLNGSNERAAS